MKRIHPLLTFLSAALLSLMVACAPSEKRESVGEYIDDTAITTRVKAALAADPELKAREINVETYKGTVQLSGFVASRDDVAKAARLARGIKGVDEVKNSILVK